MSRPFRLALCLVLTGSALSSGLVLIPEACGLGLTFGVVLMLLQLEGSVLFRVGALVFGRDPRDTDGPGRKAGVIGFGAVALLSAVIWSVTGGVDRGLSFVGAAAPFILFAATAPAAFVDSWTSSPRQSKVAE